MGTGSLEPGARAAASEIGAARARRCAQLQGAGLRSRLTHRRPPRAHVHRARFGAQARRGDGRRAQQAGRGNRGGRSAVVATEMTEAQSKAGLVAGIGAPHAGKSTLVNALVGQKVAIVSPKAQTTRARLMGIAVEAQSQILLVDTPGIFEPRRRLDRAMVAAAWTGAHDADLILLVIDAATGLKSDVERIVASLQEREHPLFL